MFSKYANAALAYCQVGYGVSNLWVRNQVARFYHQNEFA